MRWYACPDVTAQQLGIAPRLASWNKTDDRDQVRLRAYLDDTEALLAGSQVDGPWALRLDVGLPAGRDLLDGGDLDNYAYPLAHRLRDPRLVSVWCTKQQNDDSYVQIEPAREVPPPLPSTDLLVAKTTASASTVAFKEEIYAAVEGAAELPTGPVKLELSFVIGPRRNWLNLWKQTIDSLDPLLGRTYPDRPWHPRDGRITELGMHVEVNPAAHNETTIGIAAGQAPLEAQHIRYILRTAARANGWQVRIHDGPHASDTYLLPEKGLSIQVTWSAYGEVLTASSYGGAKSDYIGRGYAAVPYVASTRTNRVLHALTSQTGIFPPA